MSDNVYTPDKWVIVKFAKPDGEVFYKVLGSWSGGYLHGDSWRLSSGLEKIEVDGNYLLMRNYSGSTYKVHKNMEGMNVIASGVYNSMKKDALEQHSVEVNTITVNEYQAEMNRPNL